MRPLYDPSLIDALRNVGQTETVFDNPVLVKPIPDDPRPGVLDPREFDLAKKTLASRAASSFSLESVRKPNELKTINLNTIEISTEVIPLSLGEDAYKLYVFSPSNGEKGLRKVIFFIHGGSFITGSVQAGEDALKYLAEKSDSIIVSIEYSLAPEHPFPIAFNQCKAGIDYVFGHADELGVDTKRFYLSGDSAGANLALGVCELYEKDTFAGMLLYYPAVAMDLEALPFQWKEEEYVMDDAYRPYIIPRLILGRSDGKEGPLGKLLATFYLRNGESLRDPRISPLFAFGASFPKILMFTCEFDGLRLQDEYFASKVNKEGGECACIRYKGIHHAFIEKFGLFPQAEDSILECVKFLGGD